MVKLLSLVFLLLIWASQFSMNAWLGNFKSCSIKCKSSYFHLRNLSSIRKYLTTNAAHTIVHAFISSRLDYCNALLYGLPKYLVDRLQHVQNSAARVVTFTGKFDHITPVLIDLHWLPVYYRVIFKLLLLSYKALNGLAPCYLEI